MMTEQPVDTIDGLVEGRDEELVVVDRGPVRLLVFNRPAKRNAMTMAMRRGYAAELARADADPAVHCVIITGAHGFFTAGVDIKERPPTPNMALVRPHPVEAGRGFSKPLIAMVDGPCITGGLELALGCTFIIGSDRSSYAETHLKIGLLPGWGGSALLVNAIGARRAAQMQLSGERISAETALHWGLINEMVPADRLVARCMELANAFAALNPEQRAVYTGLNRKVAGGAIEDTLAAELFIIERARALMAAKQTEQ